MTRSFVNGPEALPATESWTRAKILFPLLIIGSAFLFLGPALLFWLEEFLGLDRYRFGTPAWQIGGVIVFVLGAVLVLASAGVLFLKGNASGELVIAGPYRHVRNPIVIAVLTQGVGIGLFLGSSLVLLYVVVGMLLWNYIMRRWEEMDLEQRFGDSYRLYCRRVRCWRPRWRPYDPTKEDQEPALAALRTTPPGRMIVLYDGQCRFCQKQSRNLLRLARPGAITLEDFHQPGVLDQYPGVSHAACMNAMHLICPDGRVFAGFEAAVRAVGTRPLLGLLASLYYVPGIRLLCDVLYSLVAAYRYRLMGRVVAAGECHDGTCALHLHRKS
jgi:protein-S-isoprenylcysteine O-methyltransferase Ste14/predicted DCC family thiol-disulfide oxidoreductase YuxK